MYTGVIDGGVLAPGHEIRARKWWKFLASLSMSRNSALLDNSRGMARLKDFEQVVSARKRLVELQPDALVSELKRIFDELSLLAQDDTHAKAVATRLCRSSDFALHPEAPGTNQSGILSACCVANVLRIYAPKAPYSTPAVGRLF